MHGYGLDEAKRLKERLSSEFNYSKIWITEFNPIMGYICGTRAIGFAFYKEN
jgi:fatty acid-binding protein DegV